MTAVVPESPPEFEEPTTVYAEYWPATVLMPDGTTRRRVRVYATDTGLHLFFTKPPDNTPHWFSALDFEQAAPDIHARNVGVDFETADGLVVVTPTGGCGCGASLRHWHPTWARDRSPWPVTL